MITLPLSATASLVQRKPLLITLGIHAVLLLMLLLWKFSLPEAPVSLPEMGMEVNLGASLTGSGTDQPMDMEDPAETVSAMSGRAAAAASSTDVERGNDDEAPAVADAAATRSNQSVTRPSTRNTGAQSATETTRPQARQQPRFVYQGSSGRGGNSAAANMPGTGEGITTGAGDQGVPGGTPGASSYTGSPGSGTGGISHSLDGRSIIAFPPKEAQFREGGRVVVRVTVDREGVIVNKQIKSSTNTELSPIALRKLQQVKFNRSETAPAEQFGDITFVFKTRH